MHEVSAVYYSPHAPMRGSSASARLRLSLQAGPICLIPRSIQPDVAAVLDGLAEHALPTFDISGPGHRVRPAASAALLEADSATSPLFAWLHDDVCDLIDLFANATGADTLRTCLRVRRHDMGRPFHADQVAFRLVTSYRGPGVEWLAPRSIAQAPPDQPLGAEAIRRTDRGAIAIMRGERGGTPARPGVLHRFAAVDRHEPVGLSLTIHDVEVNRQAGKGDR